MEFELVGNVEEVLRKWPLPEGRTAVGRRTESAIAILDRSVSREHAALTRSGESIVVEDLGSRNGTWVNGERIRAPQNVHPGDAIAFGNVRLSLRGQDIPLQPKFTDPSHLESTGTLLWQEVQETKTRQGEATSLDIFTELGEILILDRTEPEIHESALAMLEKLVPFRRACLLLLDAQGEPILANARYRVGSDGQALALSRTMIDAVVRDRTSLLVQDAQSHPDFKDHASIIQAQTRSALVTPLFDNTKVIGVLYCDTRDFGMPYTKEQLRQMALLGNLLAVKITNARLSRASREVERIEQEMATAAQIQRSLLTSDPPCPEGYELCVQLEPCSEVAGDLYDVLELSDHQYAFLLGDVVGHGVGAALLMSNALAATRALLEDLRDPRRVIERLQAQLLRTTERRHFLTLFLGVLDTRTHTFRYVNAGHEIPVLFGPDAAPIQLESTGPPVGLLDDAIFEAAEIVIPKGGVLCAWSDGITEAHRPGSDPEPRFFGEVLSLHDLLAAHSKEPPQSLVTSVFAEVDRFLEGSRAPDDRTLLVLRRG